VNKEEWNCLPPTIKDPLTTGFFVLARYARRETSSPMIDAARERGSIERNARQLMTVSTPSLRGIREDGITDCYCLTGAAACPCKV
jgi:hypothetical protein